MKWTPIDAEQIVDPASILMVLIVALMLAAVALFTWGMSIRARGKRRALSIILNTARVSRGSKS